MSITTELDTMDAELTQRQDAFQAASQIEYFSRIMDEVDTVLQKLKDGGNFNTIPTDTKQSLNSAWMFLKTCQTAYLTPEITEVINWVRSR